MLFRSPTAQTDKYIIILCLRVSFGAWENPMEVIMEAEKKFFSARNVTGLSVLIALVVVLQIWGSNVKIGPTSLNFVLIPVVLGAVVFGPLAGGFLGFVSGLIILIYGIAGADPFTAVLFADHPFLTSAVCLVKGIACGAAAGWAFRLIAKKYPYAGVFTAAAIAPIVNTGLFILGALFMSDTLSANFVADGSSVFYFLVIGVSGVNFLLELGLNLVFAPALYRVIRAVTKNRKK